MENLKEIFNSEDYTDKVVNYSELLKDIGADIIVVNKDSTKLIAYGKTIDDVLEYVSQGVVIFLPPKDAFFAGSNI